MPSPPPTPSCASAAPPSAATRGTSGEKLATFMGCSAEGVTYIGGHRSPVTAASHAGVSDCGTSAPGRGHGPAAGNAAAHPQQRHDSRHRRACTASMRERAPRESASVCARTPIASDVAQSRRRRRGPRVVAFRVTAACRRTRRHSAPVKRASNRRGTLHGRRVPALRARPALPPGKHGSSRGPKKRARQQKQRAQDHAAHRGAGTINLSSGAAIFRRLLQFSAHRHGDGRGYSVRFDIPAQNVRSDNVRFRFRVCIFECSSLRSVTCSRTRRPSCAIVCRPTFRLQCRTSQTGAPTSARRPSGTISAKIEACSCGPTSDTEGRK